MKGRRTNRLKLLLRLAIGVFIGILVLIFIRYRLSTQNIQKPASPDKSEATLSINRFNHTAMIEGEKHWKLTAESAQMFSEKNLVRLETMKVRYFADDGPVVHMTADEGQLNMDSKNMTARGNVAVRHPRYTLETENLQYHNDSNIILINKGVAVSGDNAKITADTAEYKIDSATVTFEGNVEGWFREFASK
mgnify:CR=1 FL=1